MKPPAASPGRAEKPQLPAPAPPGLARLLLSKSRRGARSRRAPPATSPMFVSRGAARTRAAADGAEPSSPKVTCIGQVRMRKAGKKKPASASAAGRDKAGAAGARGGGYYYCRCLKKAFLCGGLFAFDSRKRRHKAPPPEAVVERGRRSPWVFSSRDVAVAAAPKTAADPRSGRQVGEDEDEEEEEEEEMQVGVGVFGSIGRDQGEKMGIGAEQDDEDDGDGERDAQLVSSATTTPPKNALLLMRCRSAPQNRTSPLTSRFPSTAAGLGQAPSPSPTRDALAAAASPSARKPEKNSPSRSPSPSPRKAAAVSPDEDGLATHQGGAVAAAREQQEPQLILGGDEEEKQEAEDDDGFDAYDEEEEEDETMRCSSARPLVLQRCKSEPATTAAAKMAAGPAADATAAGCFWAHGGSSGRRRHAPPAPAAPSPAPALALAGH